eukprot:jgi/Bigna1/74021/fgenesh1_pg.27_\
MVRRNYDSGDRNSIGISSEHENEADDAGTDEELLSEGRSSVEMRRIEQLGMPSGIPDELNARSQLDPKRHSRVSIPQPDSVRRHSDIPFQLAQRHQADRDVNVSLFRAYEDGDTSYYLPWYLAHFIAVGLWIRLVFGNNSLLCTHSFKMKELRLPVAVRGAFFHVAEQISREYTPENLRKATILNVEIFSNVMGVARTSILFKSATRQFSLNNRIIGDLSTVHTKYLFDEEAHGILNPQLRLAVKALLQMQSLLFGQTYILVVVVNGVAGYDQVCSKEE